MNQKGGSGPRMGVNSGMVRPIISSLVDFLQLAACALTEEHGIPPLMAFGWLWKTLGTLDGQGA